MKQLLKDIATIGAGQGAPQGDKNYCTNGTPFVKAGNLQELLDGKDINSIQQVSKEVAQKHKLKVYPKGTILFAKSGMSCMKGLVYVLPQEAHVVSHLACITPNYDISEYLRFYFSFHKPNRLIKDAAYPSISLSDIGNLEIDMKTDLERNVIIKKLQCIESVISLRQEELCQLDNLIKSRFVELFGDLNNTQFDVKSIEELCVFVKDGTHQTPEYTENKESGYKFLSSKDVTKGVIDWSKIKYIPAYLHEELYKRISPQKGDLLLAKNGTTGIAAIVDTDDIFDIYVSLALLRFNEGNNVKYLWAAINSDDTQRQFNSSLKGVGVPNLHLGEIKKTKIIVPPINLQNEFATFVNHIDKLKFEVQKSLEKTQLLFDSLMQEYFG